MKNLIIPAISLSLLFGLSACGEEGSTPKQEKPTKVQTETATTTEEKEELTAKDRADIEEFSKIETVEGLGEVTPIGSGYNDDLGIDGTDSDTKPQSFDGYDVFVENFSIGRVKPDEDMTAFLNNSEDFQMVLVQIRVQNNVDNRHANVVYEPSEMIIEVNGETIYAEPLLSDSMEAIEEGNEGTGYARFIIQNTKPIKKAILTMPSEAGSSNPTEKVFKFDVLDIKDSVYKDNHS